MNCVALIVRVGAFSLLGLATARCGQDAGGTSRTSSYDTQSDASAESKSFAALDVDYQDQGSGLQLAGDRLVSYVAKVEGGIRCFGDLYDNGSKADLAVNVANGEKIKIRKGASNCKVAYKKLTFSNNVTVDYAEGLIFQSKKSASFKKSDSSQLFVTVENGIEDLNKPIEANVEIKLVGSFLDKDSATVKNSELFVATSGEAFAAPHIKVDGDVTLFNNRIYAKMACLGQEVAGKDACKDALGQDQPLSQFDVWVTGAELEKIAIEDRYSRINTIFQKNGDIERVTDVADFSGFQLLSSGKLGIAPDASFKTSAPAYLVVRLLDGQVASYKVFNLTLSK